MPKPFPPGIIFEIIEISVFICLVKAMKLSVSFLILNRVTVAMEIAAGSQEDGHQEQKARGKGYDKHSHLHRLVTMN